MSVWGRVGAQPLEVEHLPEESRHHDNRLPRGERAQRAEQHLIEPRSRLALLRDLVDDLEHGDCLREAVEVLSDRAEVVDRLGLADDVELAALVEQQRGVTHRLEPSAEPALRLAHALRDRPHLPARLGHEHDDAIGLAELVGAQHDAALAIEAHRTHHAVRIQPVRSASRRPSDLTVSATENSSR